MKTLVIVSHPNIEESNSQQFLKEGFPERDEITYHYLESAYPSGVIDVKAEQDLVKAYDRIIFQFPFYWYQAPSLLKQWFDDVLEEGIAFGNGGNLLRGKEMGLVLVIGVAEKEYQVGGSEHFTISQLTAPFQALAKKVGMTFLKPLAIHQFYYLTEEEKWELLIDYQQYLTLENFSSLHSKVHWLVEALENLSPRSILNNSQLIIDHLIDTLEDNQLELDEMKLHLDN